MPMVGENLPVGQSVQARLDVAPVIEEILPALQLMHEDAPAPEYLPVPQVVHTLTVVAPVTVENLPAAQLRHEEVVDPPVAVEYFPEMQLVHVAVLVAVLYLPAAHAQQVAPAPAPSQSVFPAVHETTWEVTTCARHRSRTPQSARGAPRPMTGLSNISDCMFIESIRISPNTDLLCRRGKNKVPAYACSPEMAWPLRRRHG